MLDTVLSDPQFAHDPEASSIPVALGEQAPLVIPGTWEDYLELDARFQESGVSVKFYRGWIEIMSPVSEEHESRKSHLGALVGWWCVEKGVRLAATGNATLKREGDTAGEPDESYFIHTREEKSHPDLVIEVALTSGGLSKRHFYASLEVPELWIWRGDALEVHLLNPETREYRQSEASGQLPGIDLAALAECSRMEYLTDAIAEFRIRIQGDSS